MKFDIKIVFCKIQGTNHLIVKKKWDTQINC